MSFPKLLKALLREKKMSQVDLARLTGFSEVGISYWLHEKRRPGAEEVKKIALALGVSPSALLDDPDAPPGWVKVPVIGRVPAGVPMEAIEEHEGEVLVPGHVAKNAIALRVSGNSMVPSIQDGDVVLVKLDPDPEPGSIVVARKNLDGEVTVKRLVRQGKVTLLVPENQEYDPIMFNAKDDWHIIGRVTKLIRDME